MRKNSLKLMLMGIALGLSAAASASSVTYSFSGLRLAGFEVTPVAGTFAGTLTGVAINASLDVSDDFTFASDLMILVGSLDAPLLQVGGFSDTGALESHAWANGDDSVAGTTVNDTVSLTTPITFSGNSSDPAVWLGNGFPFGDVGTWSGSIELLGVSATPAVPEPLTPMLLLAGMAGIGVLELRKRRQSAEAAC